MKKNQHIMKTDRSRSHSGRISGVKGLLPSMTAVLLYTCFSCGAIEPGEGITLYGVVSDTQGKALENVVVSDGYRCAVTDRRGVYRIPRSDSAKYVFVSVPSGYEAPTQEGFGSYPAFYAPARSSNGDSLPHRVDFGLIPVERSQERFILYALGDPQPNNYGDIERFRRETVSDVRQTHSDEYPGMYAVSAVLGDIVGRATRESHPRQKKVLGELGIPVHSTVGNHDKDQIDYTGEHYENVMGPFWYSYNVGDVHFVCLDNIHGFTPNGPGGRLTTGIGDAQLEWLRQDLSLVSREKLLIVQYHIPMRSHKSHVNHDKVLELIAEFPNRATLCGHTHRNEGFYNAQYDLNEYIFAGSCGEFWISHVSNDGTPNGYGVFEIEGNRLANMFYKGTGHPIDYQIRLYRGNTVFPRQDGEYTYGLEAHTIVANVFAGDMGGKWKIELYENGRLSGEMEKMPTTAWDGVNVAYHSSVLHRLAPYFEAPMHHSYRYTLKDPKAEVLVKATDPWGNVYTQDHFTQGTDLSDADGSFRQRND